MIKITLKTNRHKEKMNSNDHMNTMDYTQYEKKKKMQEQKHGDTRRKEIQHSGTIPKYFGIVHWQGRGCIKEKANIRGYNT
jgi:hypothetical protein